MNAIVEVEGIARVLRGDEGARGRRPLRARGRGRRRCSGPTVRGRPPSSASCRRCSSPTPGPRPSPGSTWWSSRPRCVVASAWPGQYAAVDETLTGRENLEMVGRLSRLSKSLAAERAAEVLERVSLNEAADRPLKTYSGGMRRRIDLGAGLVAHRGCSCSTNRPPVSTRPTGSTCGPSSASWSTRAPPSSSPRSTSRKPTSSPRTWWSSTTGSSSRTARRPSSSRGWRPTCST